MIKRVPLTPKLYVEVTCLFVPANASIVKLANVILAELTHVSILKPLAALPPACVETPLPNLTVCAPVTLTLLELENENELDAVEFACGSTIVKVPPVQFNKLVFN